ncbi:hypothetical protein JHK87_031697 [Glycine soja]|nr:hypothetical protein JHK87_031697 [Glycine soja]
MVFPLQALVRMLISLEGSPGQPQDLGRNISMWMLLERVRFTLDGIECNKIGVSYEAFNQQPNFCSSPFWTCLHNQLWNFRESAGSYSFSIGITEVLNTNLVLELSANDVEYVYQRSPGKIISVSVPTFEALTQFGVATITTKNTGSNIFEACIAVIFVRVQQAVVLALLYRVVLQFNCSKDITLMEPVLKDSDYNEVDRAECQFATTTTVLDNDTKGMPFQPPEASINSFFDFIASIWNKIWTSLTEFITGKTYSLGGRTEKNALGFLTSSATYNMFA